MILQAITTGVAAIDLQAAKRCVVLTFLSHFMVQHESLWPSRHLDALNARLHARQALNLDTVLFQRPTDGKRLDLKISRNSTLQRPVGQKLSWTMKNER